MKILYFVPKNLLSFVVGTLAHIRWPHPFNEWLKNWFVQRYKLNMNEAEFSTSEYPSLGALFTRKLKPGLRPIGNGVIHPCDALISRCGKITSGQLVQAKNIHYSLSNFLAQIEGWQNFEDGFYYAYYLCPTDYHRVHSPASGKILSCTHVPGRLWPVNPWSVENISQLFAINERTITIIETDSVGSMDLNKNAMNPLASSSQNQKNWVAVVMVGATNVGKISMSFDKSMTTNLSHFRKFKTSTYEPSLNIQKGEELGIFNMGSTVILLFSKNYSGPFPDLAGTPTKMGQTLL
jgi:phosphatidylserine decarboxylase